VRTGELSFSRRCYSGSLPPIPFQISSDKAEQSTPRTELGHGSVLVQGAAEFHTHRNSLEARFSGIDLLAAGTVVMLRPHVWSTITLAPHTCRGLKPPFVHLTRSACVLTVNKLNESSWPASCWFLDYMHAALAEKSDGIIFDTIHKQAEIKKNFRNHYLPRIIVRVEEDVFVDNLSSR
jgi:hypothetical protein